MIKKLVEKFAEPVFALFIVQTPLLFTWHLELVFKYTGRNFTNGFGVFDGMVIYHLTMYLLFVSTLFAGIYVILNYSKSRRSNHKVFTS